MSDVIVVIGAGQIGQAVARRVSAGKHVVLADLHQSNADAAAEVLADAGFDVTTATVDVFRHGSPCMHLLRLPPHLVTLLVLFMRRACRQVRHRSKSFSPSICTEQPLSLRCSDRSSPREVPPSSSHHSPGIVSVLSRLVKTQHCQQHQLISSWHCRSSSQAKSPIASTHINWQSVDTHSESWPKRFAGASEVPG